MKKLLATLAVTTALTLPFYVMAADNPSSDAQGSVQYKDNGGYTEKSSANETNADGTSTTVKKSTDVDVSDNGQKSTDVKSEAKTKTANGATIKKTKEAKTKAKPNGDYTASSETTDSNSKGNDVTTKKSTDVSVDANGNVTKDVKSNSTTTPPGITGMFNQTKSTAETKTVNGQVVKQQGNTTAPDNSQ